MKQRFVNHSVEDTAFIGRYHVLDVNEGVFSTGLFQKFQSLRNQVSQIYPLPLVVLHLVPNVCVVIPENIENWQYLSVIGYQCLSNHLSTQNQLLNNFQHRRYDFNVTSVQRG